MDDLREYAERVADEMERRNKSGGHTFYYLEREVAVEIITAALQAQRELCREKGVDKVLNLVSHYWAQDKDRLKREVGDAILSAVPKMPAEEEGQRMADEYIESEDAHVHPTQPIEEPGATAAGCIPRGER